MASVAGQQAEPTGLDRDEVLDILAGPFRNTWVRYFIGFEIFLVVGGFLLDYLWGSPTGFAEHPDFHMAMGAVMAGLAIVFGLIFLVIYLTVVALTIRDRRGGRYEF